MSVSFLKGPCLNRVWNEAEMSVPILQGPCLSKRRVWNEAEVPMCMPILQGQCLSLAWNEAEMPVPNFRLSSVFFRSLKLLVVSLFYKKQCYFAIHIFQLCMKNYIDVCRSLEVKTTSSNIFGIIGTYRFFIEKPYIYHYICERVMISRILPNSKRLNPPR